jgi:hypothetical protein
MKTPRTPVVVGYGQVNQRDENPSVEPIDLMVAAARAAADPRVLEAVDSVRIVSVLSWRYRDPGRLLAQRIHARDATSRYTGVGGNVPQSLVNQACLDIQSGRADLVLIAGAETFRTRTRLRAHGTKPDWTSQDESMPFAEGANENLPMVGPAELRIHLDRAAYVYPLFEQAVRIDAGESPDTHRRRIGELWSQFSDVAQANPHAWIRSALSAEKIWQPMGAEANATWLLDKSGYELGFCCINATLRDYARFGMLLANYGVLDGKEIIPSAWVRAATRPERPYLRVGQATTFNGYGYQTWLTSRDHLRFAALGVGGQAIYVDPQSKLVVVHTAVWADPGDREERGAQFKLWKYLLDKLSS